MSEKQYVGSGRRFEGKYGERIKMLFGQKDLDILVAALQADTSDHPLVGVWIEQKKDASAKWPLYGVIDTWKPDGAAQKKYDNPTGRSVEPVADSGATDNLPF